MNEVSWDIRRQGRAWREGEAYFRYYLVPKKLERDGKIFWDDEERLRMVALLLENLGVDAVVRLGDPNVWREAVKTLE
jgi:hypothetical protein